MNPQWLGSRHSRNGPRLIEFNGATRAAQSVRWRINGYPAQLLIWSLDEWERLPEQPSDAQLHPLGVWCALRLD